MRYTENSWHIPFLKDMHALQSTQLQNGYLALIRQCLELVRYMLPTARYGPVLDPFIYLHFEKENARNVFCSIFTI